jgi:hypothetical protein
MASAEIPLFDKILVLPIEAPFYSIEYVHSMRDWVKSNLLLFYMVSVAYIILVLIGKIYMKDKPKLELRKPLILWNIFLTGLS